MRPLKRPSMKSLVNGANIPPWKVLDLAMMQPFFKIGTPDTIMFALMKVRRTSGVEETFLPVTSRWNEDPVSSLLSAAPVSNLSDMTK